MLLYLGFKSGFKSQWAASTSLGILANKLNISSAPPPNKIKQKKNKKKKYDISEIEAI